MDGCAPFPTPAGTGGANALRVTHSWPIEVGMFEIDACLRTLVEREGSDLHIKVGVPPMARVHGELVPLEGHQPLTPEDTEKAFHDIAEVRSQTEFEEAGEADFSYALSGVSRFRVNTFKQRG